MDQTLKKILLIDDNANNLHTLKTLIADLFSSFTTYTAISGNEGIEMAKTHQPDVILLDILMPGIDGFEVCRILKADETLNDIPVVFVTALEEDREKKIRAMEVGAEGFLTKPIVELELTSVINAMLKLKEAHDFKKIEKQRLEQFVAERTKELNDELRQNREMNNRLSESKNMLESFLLVSRNITRSLEQSDLMKEIVENATNAINLESGALYMISDNDTIILEATVPELPNDYPNEFRTAYLKNHPHIGEAFTTNDYVLIEDTEQVALTPEENEIIQKRNLNTLLFLPISLRDKPIGVLILGTSDKKMVFSDEKISLLKGFGYQAAQIYENAKNKKQAENYTKQLEREIAERKRAEDEIQKFKTVSDQAVHGIAITDVHGNLLYINDYFSYIHGYKPDELNGQNLSILHNEQQIEEVQRIIKALITDGQFINREVWHKHKDGNVFPMLMNGVVIKDENGTVQYLSSTAIDITDRKQAEEALQISEIRNRSLLEAIPDMIFVFDKQGHFVDFHASNPSGLLMPPQHFIGKHFAETLPPDISTKTDEVLKKVFSTKLMQEFEYQFELQGQMHYFEARAVYSTEEQVLTFVRDVTERKQAETELMQTQKRFAEKEVQYRLLAENSQDLIYVYRLVPEPYYEYISPSCFQLTGYAPEEGYADPFAYHKFINTPEGVERFTRFLLNPSQPTMIEEEWQRKDGTRIWIEQVVCRNFDDTGNLISIQSTVRDITERKRAEEAVISKNKMLRSIAEFTQVVALATPEQLYSTIVAKLKEVTGAGEVILNLYDEQTSELVVTQTTLSEEQNGMLRKLLGNSIKGFRTPVSNDMYREMTTQKVGRFNSIHESTFGAMPRVISKTIEKIFSFGWYAPLALIHQDKLIGTIMIAGKKGIQEPEIEELLAYSNAAANVIMRMNAETELLKSKEKYEFLVNSLGEGLMQVDNDDRILFVNQALCNIFGYQEDELIGQIGYEKLIYEDDKNIIITKNKSRQEISSESYEVRGIKKTGETIWLSISGSTIKDDQGIVVSTVGLLVDITGRKRSEIALHESEERYRKLISTVPDLIVLTDLDGTITYINDIPFPSLSHFSNEVFLGQNMLSFMSEDDLPRAIENMKLMFERKLGPVEYKLRKDNGFIIYTEVNGDVIYDSNNIPIGMVYVIRDISERKQAENELIAAKLKAEESEERYKSLHNASFGGIAIHDKGIILDCNQGLSDITGYSLQELIGMNGLLLIAELSRNEVMDKILSGYEKPYEAIGLRKDGTEFPLRIEGRNIQYKGKPVRTTEFRDITEIKQAESQLRKLSQAVEQSPASVIITDPNGNIEYVNSKFTEVTGYSLEEALGQNPQAGDSGVLPKEFYKELWNTIISGKEWNGELRGKKKNGELFWESVLISPIINENGEILNYLAIKEDITNRRNAEDAIRKLNSELEMRVQERTAQLEEVNKELEAFTYSVSHDLRSPLRAVNGFAEILLEDYADLLPEDGKKTCNYIRDNAIKMGNLINELLKLSRLSRTEMMFSVIDMNNLADAAYNEVATAEQQSKITFHRGNLENCIGDGILLKQLLTNLISNAVKYTGKTEKPEIALTSEIADGNIIYTISDNGAGFDMKYVDKLFNVFQRLHSETEFEGSGVGLAIVNRIISRHEGKVWAEASVGKGAKFCFSIPVHPKS